MAKVSIVVPVYNRAYLIAKTLESFIAQTYQDWDCFVVDDRSTDNTAEIVKRYCEMDERIKYLVNNRKKGAQGARNTGIIASEAEWICIFDSDDYMYPDYMASMTQMITNDVDICVCFSTVCCENNGQKKGELAPKAYGYITDKLFTGELYIPNNQTLIRKKKLEQIGYLDEDCPSMQEWDSHIRLSLISNYITIEKFLVDYFVGGSDAISSDTKREVIGRMYILTKHLVEWKKHPKAMRRFIGAIASLINKNSDLQFKKYAYEKLCEVIPETSRYVFYYRIMAPFAKIKHLIIH